MHTVIFRTLPLLLAAAIIAGGCTQKSDASQTGVSVSQNVSENLASSEDNSEEATTDLRGPETAENIHDNESAADVTATESTSSTPSEAPSLIQKPADVDYSLTDEMTVRIIDKDGLPIRNIGVYVNHQEERPMHVSVAFAVSDNDGIAILQRLRATFSKTEQVTLALCDRNQSKLPQQIVTMAIPEDNVTPVDIVWDVPEVNQEAKNIITFHLKDNAGTPVKNAWFSLSEASKSEGSGDKVVANYGVGSPEYTTELHDWNRCTDENGEVAWVNLPEGCYNANVFLFKPPFSNVKSNHPRLQQSFENPISHYRFYVAGEKEQKLLLTLP